MRKTYLKPEIVFEDFSLCENIAAGCEIIVPAPRSGQCGYAYEGGGGATLFVDDTTGCSDHMPDSESNGFCYHVPIQSNNLFNS